MIGNSHRSKHNSPTRRMLAPISPTCTTCTDEENPCSPRLQSYRLKRQHSSKENQASISASSSINGGDNGGTANSWRMLESISNVLLAVEWEPLSLPIFLESSTVFAEEALEELLLSTDAKKLSFDRDPWAEAMTDPNTPDSLNPWMIVWYINKQKPCYIIAKLYGLLK